MIHLAFSTSLSIGFLILALHLLGVVAATHAILNTRTSQGAVAWAVALVTMPYLTLVPYLFLGRSRFSGYVDARRVENSMMRTQIPQPEWETDRVGPDEAVKRLGHHAIRALENMTGMPFLSGNRVRTLVNGDATFDAIFAALADARHYIVVQFFIVRDDALGQRLRDALLAKAAAGVRVYLLFDGIGSFDLPRRYIAALRAGGVEVHKFATRRLINRFQLNFRNHRKIVIVDGQRAFIGGLNVGVEYLGQKPPLAPWRDTHIEIVGPVVASIQFLFVEDWYWATQRIPALQRCRAPSGADMCCQVVGCGPADHQETGSLFVVEAINAAKSRIWLTTPYFVPDEAVFSALRLAVLRGVDARVLLPARADHRVVFAASSLYAHDAVRAGVGMYRYGPGFLHQKVILIDRVAAAVGSINLDNRSLRLNFEITLLTVDDAFAAEVEAMLEADFALATPITLDEYRRKSWLPRVLMHVARLFSPIL